VEFDGSSTKSQSDKNFYRHKVWVCIQTLGLGLSLIGKYWIWFKNSLWWVH